MNYICKNTACIINQSKATFPAEGLCPVCGNPFVAEAGFELDEIEKSIIQDYPYFIALPFKRMVEESDFYKKLHLLKDVFHNYLKFIGLLTATEFFRSGLTSIDIVKMFESSLYQPSMGDWSKFTEKTVKFLNNHQHNWFVREFPDYYQRIETSKHAKKFKLEINYTDENGNIVVTNEKTSAIIFLIYFRNTYLGHGQFIDDADSNKLFEKHYPALKILLGEFELMKNYQIIKYENGESWILKSAGINKTDIQIKPKYHHENVWIQNNSGSQMPLLPFYILPKQYISDAPEAVEIFIYEQKIGKRIRFFSPELYEMETSGEIIKKLEVFIKSKSFEKPFTESEITKERLRELIVNHSNWIISELHKEKKLLKGIYQKRGDAEASIMAFITSSKPVYFLAAEGGSGKTTLFAEMYNRFTEEKIDALFLRAKNFTSKSFISEFERVLNLKNGFDLSRFTELGYNKEQSLFIFIDGLNEYGYSLEILTSLKSFLNKIPNGTIKLLISWRVQSLSLLPEIDEEWENILYQALGADINNDDKPLLRKYAAVLPRFTKQELASAWDKYTAYKPKIYAPVTKLEELELKDKRLTAQLSNPMILRIFLHLFNNKKIKINTGFLDLWGQYLRDLNKRIPESLIFLKELAFVMFKTENQTPDIDTIINNEFLYNKIRDNDINSLYNRLKREGVITYFIKKHTQYVSFVTESFMQFVMAEAIREKNIITHGYLIDLLENNKIKGVESIIGNVLLKELQANNFEIFIELIGKKEQFIDLAAFPLAQIIEQFNTHEILNKVLDISNNTQIYKVFFLANKILMDNFKNDTRKELTRFLLDREVKFSDYYLILLNNYNLFGKELRNTILNKTINWLKSCNCDEKEKSNLYSELVGVYYDMRELEKAGEFAKKNLEIEQKVYGKDHLKTASVYNNLGAINHLAGRLEVALKYYKRSLEIRLNLLNENHEDVAISYNNIGGVYDFMYEMDKALNYYQRALKIRLNIFGSQHPQVATSYNNIGVVYRKNEEYNKALDYYLKSLKIRQNIFGEDHSITASSYNNMAVVYQLLNNFDEAIKNYEKTASILLANYDESFTNLIKIYNNLSKMYFEAAENLEKEKEYHKALVYYNKCLEYNEKGNNSSLNSNCQKKINKINNIFSGDNL